MPVDNQVYDAMADSWWDESGFLHVLRGLNPARFGYMRRVLTEDLGIDPRGKWTLDVGCGGGILAEEFARLGCAVTGIDPSEKSLAAAQAHARAEGLEIDSGKLLRATLERFDGRGGGQPALAQGGLPDASRLEAALDTAVELIQGM